LTAHTLECVAADERRPGRAFVGTVDSGLQRTTDGGETWDQVLEAGDRVTSVTVSPHDPAVLWAGTEPSAVYRSTDGGSSWTERPGLTDLDSAERWSFPPRPHTHHVRWSPESTVPTNARPGRRSSAATHSSVWAVKRSVHSPSPTSRRSASAT